MQKIIGTYKGDGVFDLNPFCDEKAIFNFSDESFSTTARFDDDEIDFEAMRKYPGLIRDIKVRDLEARRFYDASDCS